MKYVFFGSPRFASLVLEDLCLAGEPPLAVVTSPDRPVGRFRRDAPPPAKIVAGTHQIPIHQPEKLSEYDFETLAKQADFFVVAAYAKIIPQRILDLPKFGTFGVHPSLLPRFRGATPIQSAILAGEETGITVYKMDAQVDHGLILKTANLSGYLPDEIDYLILEERLAHLGVEVLLKIMSKYLAGSLTLTVQDESQATLTKKFKTEDAEIRESDLRKALEGQDSEVAKAVLRKILAFSQEPGAWTVLSGPLVISSQTLPVDVRIKLLNGKIQGGKLQLTRFQVAGRKVQDIS